MPIDVERWNESGADPLADIEAWRKLFVETVRMQPMVESMFSNIYPKPIDKLPAEMIRYLASDGEVTVIVHEGAADFSVIEQHMLATLYHETGTHLDLPPAGEIEGFMVFKQSAGQIADFLRTEPEAPAVKQNGRSAAYLQHDPTKKHRRTKR